MTKGKRPSVRKSSPNEWLAKFRVERPNYERLSSRLEVLFKDLLRASTIDYHLLESRTKTEESLREKVARAAKSYDDPLRQIDDLSGVRIITYYQDDADKIAKIIKEEFQVREVSSTGLARPPSEFGYNSSHFIVSINEERAGLLEWNGLRDLKAEIQVRTVLQHAWAAISHKLQYKREEDVPVELRRKLFRLSALFELSDDEFMALRSASGTVVEEIESRINAGDNDIAIDYLSMKQFLSQSEVVFDLVNEAGTVGFEIETTDDVDSSISDLIFWAGKFGLSTLASVEAELVKSKIWSHRYLQMQILTNGDPEQDDNIWHAQASFILILILFGLFPSLVSAVELKEQGWHQGIAETVVKVARSFDKVKQSEKSKSARHR